MGWVGHMARMAAKEIYIRILQGNLKKRSHLEDLDIEGE